jgi:hypothetical protein
MLPYLAQRRAECGNHGKPSVRTGFAGYRLFGTGSIESPFERKRQTSLERSGKRRNGFFPLLYDASLFAMRIAGKRQHIETVRINNTGWNPALQSVRHTFDNLLDITSGQNQLPDYITVGEHGSPIDDRRTRFNRSLLVNTTNSLKLKNDYDVKANITYEKDALDFTRSAYTDYFDSTLSPWSETEYLQTWMHTLSGQFVLQANKPNVYLKNNLHTDLGWNSAVSAITGSYDVGQHAKKPVFNISNELQAVKRIENRILTVSSINRMTGKPH